MAYEVLARKWRPQQFSDVVGQEHVTRTLVNAITSGRIAHAYLFVGPRGIGKTSLARILAKALNCQQGVTPTPCDRCDSCREIMAGASLDVLEIDGASNTGVDQVRQLRENVMFTPARGPYKVYIIDEVHMLSAAAFNALLKTLEEPPAHVKFIFATTDPQKVLPTVVSRCQRFDLRRIPVPLIVERLRVIAAAEQIQLDDDAALAIARGAEGGLRDAESALDQLIAFRGTHITEADVLSVFGLASRQALETLAECVLKGDIPGLVRIVADLDGAGKDLQRLVVELLEHFRNLLIAVFAPEAAAALDVTDAQMEVLKRQACLANADRLLRLADTLAQTEERLKYTLSKRVLVETTLIRCARLSRVASLAEILQQLEDLKQGLTAGPVREAGAATAPAVKAVPPPAPRGGPAGGAAPGTQAGPSPTSRAQAAGSPSAASGEPADATDELAKLKAQWHEIIERVGKLVSLARGLLIDARPVAVHPDRVVIGFDPEFVRNIETMRLAHNHKATQTVLSQTLGRTVNVEFVALGPGNAVKEAGADRAAGVGEAGGPEPAKERRRRSHREWAKDPAVQKTMEALGGSILEIRD